MISALDTQLKELRATANKYQAFANEKLAIFDKFKAEFEDTLISYGATKFDYKDTHIEKSKSGEKLELKIMVHTNPLTLSIHQMWGLENDITHFLHHHFNSIQTWSQHTTVSIVFKEQ